MVRVLTGGVLMLAIAMGMGRFAFTPILPAMQEATGLGGDGAGLLASLNYLGYFLGAVGAGLVPRGRVRTLTFRTALVASVTTTAAMGLGEAMAGWVVLRFLSGLASAGVFILGVAMVLDALARAGRETLAGWMYTGVGLGIAGSGLFVALAGGRLGWAGDWLVLGALCAVLAVPVWLWVHDRDAPPANTAAAAGGKAAGGRLSVPLLLLTVAYFLEGGGYIVTGTFLVALLKAVPDTAAVGEAAWMVAGLAAIPSGLLWAAAGRRFGLWQALIAAHLVQAVGVALPLAGGPAAGILSAALYGGTFIGIVTLAFTLGRQLSGGASARVIGALTAAYGLGQILGPLPAGIAVERTGSFDAALMGAAAAVALAALCLLAGMVLARRSAASTGEVPCRT
ncbi:YbfB/YjiJ family MFS transporter [Azospirillum halopraeferens]|uniref:YbfB/YjiJ family MFS transporter n=1 Tax=Azospirillum halopraeferens TaxID=34010 RepID=UPI0004157205|nr:YbfB/YjiJ family MFS transporter [Azospirillum halopraeferens]